MSKEKFRELAAMIKDDLPGATELSRKRQAAAGGNPTTVEINVQAMCDAERRFTFVSCVAAGSCHDRHLGSHGWAG